MEGHRPMGPKQRKAFTGQLFPNFLLTPAGLQGGDIPLASLQFSCRDVAMRLFSRVSFSHRFPCDSQHPFSGFAVPSTAMAKGKGD